MNLNGHDMVDHVCVADHCIACCPVAKSYSEGFESARTIYYTDERMRLIDPPPSLPLIIVNFVLLFAIIIVVANKVKVLERKYGEASAEPRMG